MVTASLDGADEGEAEGEARRGTRGAPSVGRGERDRGLRTSAHATFPPPATLKACSRRRDEIVPGHGELDAATCPSDDAPRDRPSSSTRTRNLPSGATDRRGEPASRERERGARPLYVTSAPDLTEDRDAVVARANAVRRRRGSVAIVCRTRREASSPAPTRPRRDATGENT
jgi:hypothetical protein